MKIILTFILSVMITVLAACGGGSSNAPPPVNNAPPPVGGIGRTGAFALGPITNFGSVVVNGVRYDTSGAMFTIDDAPGTESDLSVGQIVTVKGSIDDNLENATADEVSFDDNVEGPIAAGSIGASSFVVLGQTVIIDDVETTFDDDISPASILGLQDGDIVEVSGHVMDDGSIAATRIERRTGLPLEFEVTGIVSASPLDPTMATTFMINGLVIDFASRGGPFDDFPGGRAIMVGDPVEVKGETTLGPAGELIATRVEYKGDRLAGDEGDHVEIEGFISTFVTSEEFSIGEVSVITIPGTTVFEGGEAIDLGLNIKVEVEGEYNGANVLVATKVQIKLGKAVRITATVDGINLPDELVLLGITIQTDQLITRFEDKTDVVREDFGVDDLNANVDYVEVRGQEIPLADGSGSGIVFAAILERDDPDTETIIQGFVQSENDLNSNFVILGVTVQTDVNTEFRMETSSGVDTITAADFFDPTVDRTGSLIKAKSTTVMAGPPVSFLAEEVEIQME